MNLKNTIIIALFLWVSSGVGFAQQMKEHHHHFDRKEYVARRNAYLTAELKLTPDEAASFLPLVEEMQKKIYEATKSTRFLERELRKKKTVSDADYLKVIEEKMKDRKTIYIIENQYFDQFKQILPASKLYYYRGADMKFGKKFIDERRNRSNKKE